jgi:hypothetical protein
MAMMRSEHAAALEAKTLGLIQEKARHEQGMIHLPLRMHSLGLQHRAPVYVAISNMVL